MDWVKDKYNDVKYWFANLSDRSKGFNVGIVVGAAVVIMVVYII